VNAICRTDFQSVHEEPRAAGNLDLATNNWTD
jgi:hypothetical protein